MVLTKEPMGNVTKRLLNVLQIALNFLCTSLSDHSVLMLIPLEGWLWFWLLFGFLNFWVCCSTARFTQATQGVGFTFLSVLVLLPQVCIMFPLARFTQNKQQLCFPQLTIIAVSPAHLHHQIFADTEVAYTWLTFRSITDNKLFLRVLAVLWIRGHRKDKKSGGNKKVKE